MRRTSAALRRPRASPRSISRFTAPSRSPSFAAGHPPAGGWMRKLHPLRLQYEIFSDANPLMAPLAALGRSGARRTASPWPPTIRSSPCRRPCPARLSPRSTRGASSARHAPSGRSWRSTVRRRCRPPSGIDPQRRGRCGRRPRARCIANSCKRASPNSSRISRGGLREARHSRAPLCGHAAGRDRRARRRGAAPHSRRPCATCRCGLQGDRARAILHAADRPGGRARRHSVDASARCRNAAKAFDLISQVLSARGEHSAGSADVSADRPAFGLDRK